MNGSEQVESRRTEDPFLFDAERLRNLASKNIVRRGIAYFKEGRVIDLGWSEERVWASVEGSTPGAYQVDLFLDEDRELATECDCPFEWEPACKHVVATFLAYAARQPVAEAKVHDAASEAVAARRLRGRTEVSVKHVAGDRWFGTWQAHSLDRAAAGGEPYRVEIRSVGERYNYCSCPDFAVNRLGTCKHVEAVLHRLEKKAPKKFKRLAAEGPSVSFIYLDWRAALPRIRIHRAGGEDSEWLVDFFDSAGVLRGEPLEVFQSLEERARREGTPILTEEVENHIQRLAEEAERRTATAGLEKRLRDAEGRVAGVDARLYPYQLEGVAFLATAGRALLADDMGLGKTLQTIAATVVLRRHRGVRRALVVCPTSLKHQWAREIERFSGLETTIVEGTPAARLALYRRRSAFTVVNYEVLLRDVRRVQEILAPDLLILDEAQRIKNWRTKSAAAVKSLDTPFAFVLTGTPLENRLEDLYSLMQVVDPRVLGPLWSYLLEFHVTDERGQVLGYRNLSELRRRLEPVMLRRDKSLVRHQLPERIDSRLDVELDRRQRDLHDEAMAAAARLGQISKKRKLTPAEEKRLMAVLQTARMACNAAGLVDGETEGSPKLTELANLFEDLCVEGGHKVVVFSQWRRMTEKAEELARGLGLGVVHLHGGVAATRRTALIDRFRDDPATQIFLSTDAGGVGLNLQTASVLINLDLPWNPAVLEQRIGRVHRLGQANPVQVILMVARQSYEERIASLLVSKRDLFRNVVAEGAEDVVGVARRQVEIALETLGTVVEDSSEKLTVPERETIDDPPPPSKDRPTVVGTVDESLSTLVEGIQAALGNSLQQIVIAGGGVVVVATPQDASAEHAVQDLGVTAGVDVAVVDPRAWATMSRLGLVVTSSTDLTTSEGAAPAPAAAPATQTVAERKIAAAAVLSEQGFGGEAVAMAAVAMLHTLATNVDDVPPIERAALWLHGDLVPNGRVSAKEAASIDRAISLSSAGDLPEHLVTSVLEDAERFLGRLGQGAAQE